MNRWKGTVRGSCRQKEKEGTSMSLKLNRQSPRPMHCPVCPDGKGRIIDLAPHMDISCVELYPPQESHKAQFFCKCPRCKSQIGVALKIS